MGEEKEKRERGRESRWARVVLRILTFFFTPFLFLPRTPVFGGAREQEGRRPPLRGAFAVGVSPETKERESDENESVK